MGFVVDKVALGEVSIRVLQFSPLNNIPPILHNHLHLHVALSTRPNERSLETFENAMLFRKSGSMGSKSTFTFFAFKGLWSANGDWLRKWDAISGRGGDFPLRHYLKTSSGLYFSSRLLGARSPCQVPLPGPLSQRQRR